MVEKTDKSNPQTDKQSLFKVLIINCNCEASKSSHQPDNVSKNSDVVV